MDGSRQKKKSVLMFPWLAHGHISPFLELAKKFSDRKLHIYLCSTPVLLSSIKKRLDQKQNQKHHLSIQLIEFHLPSSPELPPHRHTTNGLPPHLMPTLKSSFDTAGPPLFSDILKTLNPDLVIYDHYQLWAPAIASSQNIPAARFLTTGALTNAVVLHVFNNPGKPFPFPEVSLGFLKIMPTDQKHAEPSAKEKARKEKYSEYEESQKKSCEIVLIKTCRDLEGKYIDYLSVLAQKRIIPVGPLVEAATDEDEEEDDELLRWLDRKEKSSTVYISFGSESFLKEEDIEEVGYGLELSGVNFIWVLRFPEEDRKIRAEDAVPEGFVERVGERGRIVEGWAPQRKILGHSSTGAFVSHCGWSSLMESVSFGVPIVAMPLSGPPSDQLFNAKFVEAVGLGVEVKREENGRVSREEIARMIRKVMVEKNGEDVRFKAREMSESIRRRGEEEIDGAVEELANVLSGSRP